MGGFITALDAGVTAAALWGVLTSIVPFLIIIVPVALGFYFVRKLIKGAAHAKVKI